MSRAHLPYLYGLSYASCSALVAASDWRGCILLELPITASLRFGALQATILTEIRGKDQKTYTLSNQGHLLLQHSGSVNKDGGTNLLMGLKGKGNLPHRCYIAGR